MPKNSRLSWMTKANWVVSPMGSWVGIWLRSGPCTMIFLALGRLAVTSSDGSHCSLRSVCLRSLKTMPCTLDTMRHRMVSMAPMASWLPSLPVRTCDMTTPS